MSVEQTPPLSREGSEEVQRELAAPPEDTPERRAVFAEVRRLETTGRTFPDPRNTVRR